MNINKSIWKRILTTIGFIILFLAISIFTGNHVQAMQKWNGSHGGMPSFGGKNPTTGLMPQIYIQERTVSLPEERWNILTKSWNAVFTGGNVYCAKQGTILRNGKFDSKIYYAEGGTTYNQQIDVYKSSAVDFYKQQYAGKDNLRVSASVKEFLIGKFDKNETAFTLVVTSPSGGGGGFEEVMRGTITNAARSTMQKVMAQLAGQEKPQDWDAPIDPVNTYHEWDGDPNLGPQVCVMETNDRAENGYTVSETGTYSTTGGGTNAKAAYALTALENVYGNPEYANQYTAEDLQTAYWILTSENSSSLVHLTENGRKLAQKAEEYGKFIEEIKDGYKGIIDAQNAQIVVNREKKEYIVGPFKANYPDYEDISYIKSMYLTTDTGNPLYVDQNHDEFRIVCETNSSVIMGSNGIPRQFPKSGESFFIVFSAEKTNNPTKAEIHINFEYISNCKVDYERFTSNGNIYRYIGYTETSGEYEMAHGTWEIHVNVHYTETTTRTGHTQYCLDNNTHGRDDEHFTCCGGQTYYDTTTYDPTFTYSTGEVYQPYVQMKDKKEVGETGQPETATSGGEREYKIIEATAIVGMGETPPNVPPDGGQPIDLTIHLGGTVWVDNLGGKETAGDAKFSSSDTPMANVTVTIYNADGSLAKTSSANPTKTDTNGNYVFKGLNAMKQYYIKFTYNSQYYEPVTYASPQTTRKSADWAVNSNGTDTRSERLDMNARFATIGSTPANYNGLAGTNKTYTRDELKAAGAIDDFGNPTGGGDASMQQFIRDCQLDSLAGNNGTPDLYPLENIFVVDDKVVTREFKRVDLMQNLVGGAEVTPLYPMYDYINQGYNARQEVDLALKKDVEKATLEINGKTHVYQYNQRENVSDDEYERTWDVEARISDAYYDTRYSRELFKSDYAYKIGNYGENPGQYGKDLDDELKVFITYKLTIRNQSMSIQGRINEIVDYFDEDYTFVPSRSSIYTQVGDVRTIIHANKQDGSSIFKENETIYPGGKANIQGYKNLYITGLGAGTRATERTYYYENGEQKWRDREIDLNDGVYLKSGQTAYVYLTFEVNKKDNWLILDETVDQAATPIGVGKENIAEINGFSTRYAGGTQVANVGDVGGLAAGLVDRDSNPGNVEYTGIRKDMSDNEAKEVYKKFEDDTDKAPNLRLILYKDDKENRVINGAVWEDERNKINGAATVGDGIRNNETPVNGVTVQLVELMDNGTQFIWRTFENGSGTANSTTPIININGLVPDYNIGETGTGKYAFKSFMPGNYIVRYIYGDTIKTVLVNDTSSSDEAKNISNVYGQKGLNAKSYNGQDYKSTIYQAGLGTYDGNNTHASYTYDIGRSDTASNVSDAKDLKERRNQVVDYSDDNVMNHIAEVLASYREQPSYNGTKYNQTQIQSLIGELMDRTKMTAETGKIDIELEYNRQSTGDNKNNNQTSYSINNVDLGLEERPKAQLAIDKQVTNVKLILADGSVLFDAKQTASNVLWQDHKKYDTGYSGNFMDSSKFGTISNIRQQHASKFGLIQLSMDEELMHGATIKISYQITVTNVGEVDYKEDSFYYTGQIANTNNIVTTTANQLVDYVANNLQFYVADNSSFEVIKSDKLLSDGLINTALKNNIEKFNTIITTSANSNIAKTALVPSLYKEKVNRNAIDSVSDDLILTQLITSENDTDDLTYRNIVEIVKTSNMVGRKNEYSVVGNQNPAEDPQEIDTDRAEIVRILPPFGDAGIYYIIAAIVIATVGIIVIGVIFIKKKILKD